MEPGSEDVRDLIEHFVDAVTAHGLVELDRSSVRRSRAWLVQVLPAGDLGRLEAATRDPAAGPVRDALADAILSVVTDNPGLLTELRALLGPESSVRDAAAVAEVEKS
jgi:hypothetical protein